MGRAEGQEPRPTPLPKLWALVNLEAEEVSMSADQCITEGCDRLAPTADALCEQCYNDTAARATCTCRVTRTRTTFDSACPYHGDEGTMVVTLRETRKL